MGSGSVHLHGKYRGVLDCLSELASPGTGSLSRVTKAPDSKISEMHGSPRSLREQDLKPRSAHFEPSPFATLHRGSLCSRSLADATRKDAREVPADAEV